MVYSPINISSQSHRQFVNIVFLLITCSLTVCADIRFRSSNICISSGRKCEEAATDCCDGSNCYKRSKRDYKRCVPCKEEGKPCTHGFHCCSNKCRNKVCTRGGNDCTCGDMSLNEALDDNNIVSAVDLWSNDKSSAESKYGKIGCWNIKMVTSMSWLFFSTEIFDEDLKCWDVSSVTGMQYMFSAATFFNADISNWDVSSVTDMNNMFSAATFFNADISNWNVSSVSDMNNMFEYAAFFNADISNWNVSSVTNMNNMFFNATSFNVGVSNWDVSSVTNMKYMFFNATSFDQNLCWEISTKDTEQMFIGSEGCIDFNCCLDCEDALLC